MATRISKYPQLFSLPGDLETVPSLNGRYCKECGHVTFPPQDFGCEKCGAGPEKLELKILQGRGVLLRSATAYDKGNPAFVVASIKLVDGPVIEGIMNCEVDAELKVGLPVEALLVENGENPAGQVILDCQFKVLGG